MILTNKQEQGLKISLERYRNNEKYTVIGGYAGTGKSTLVKFIVEALNVSPDRVCYTSFTGKAAEVLRKKGNQNVSTLHKLLYESFPKPGGGFINRPKPSIPYDIIIVDEISLAPKKLIDLLFKHQVYIICLGDPFQLPPIDKDQDNHLLDNPHIFLDEIMRQAQESEIIRLTMDIRAMKPIQVQDGKEIKVLPSIYLSENSVLTWADQVLCAKNATRNTLNARMRALAGHEGPPQDGDKVIAVRNYWEDLNMNGDPLINGSIGYLKNSFKTFRNIPYWLYTTVKRFDILQAEVVTEDSEYPAVEIDYQYLTEGKLCCDWRDSYKIGKARHRIGDIIPREFEYGYAVTCHKAQGSEWDKVLVVEENFPWNKEEHARWLYTAATRASEKLVIIQQ